MRLDRNFGTGKYALILMRKLHELPREQRAAADQLMLALAEMGLIDTGLPETSREFFVVRLRDKYAQAALSAYAEEAAADDDEYAEDVQALADRAGPLSLFCKRPD